MTILQEKLLFRFLFFVCLFRIFFWATESMHLDTNFDSCISIRSAFIIFVWVDSPQKASSKFRVITITTTLSLLPISPWPQASLWIFLENGLPSSWYQMMFIHRGLEISHSVLYSIHRGFLLCPFCTTLTLSKWNIRSSIPLWCKKSK